MKIAFITGANRGLGRQAAIELAKKNINILFSYRSNEEEAMKLVEELKILGVKSTALQLEMKNHSSYSGFIEQLTKLLNEDYETDRIDYVLNNAGQALYSPIQDTSEEDFDEIIDVHFKGVFFLTQKLLPLLNDGASILNVSSGLARFSYPGSAVYASTKTAIETLSRYLAVELAPRKIRVNCIAPGAIATDFGGGKVRDTKTLNDTIAANTALGRVGLAEDIGPIMAEILAGNLNWVNGQRIESSGGIHL
ncbi:MAG: SDR family oxidoreductase [Bdellovibrionota bacterium]|nr:SDR family oxidoreductase [Bdellovibrionota bacterium]